MAARVAGTGSVMTSVREASNRNRGGAEAKGNEPVARSHDVLRYGKTYALGMKHSLLATQPTASENKGN
jgi:hypothetical protein